MAHAFTNFKYSHTIQPSEDDLEELFKIGGGFIKDSRSRSRSRHKSIEKKEKKSKQKKKKQRSRSRTPTKKKDKKEKKHKRSGQPSIEEIKTVAGNQLVRISTTERAAISNYFDNKASEALSSKIDSNFAYNVKMSRDTLPFSVITFPQKWLYEYGLPMNDIPMYRRLNHNIIVGMKSGKKTQTLLKQLNKRNCQRFEQPKQTNEDRYFHYVGIQKMESEFIQWRKTRKEADPYVIPFDSSFWADITENLASVNLDYRTLDRSQADLLRLNRQYNVELSQNPKNVQKWLEFIRIQDTRNAKLRNSLLERKLSIVERARQSNPEDTRLMVLQLQIIHELKKDNFYNTICQKAAKYLDKHPQSIELWQLYIDFKFSSFSHFANSFVRKQFQEITAILRKKTSQATSARQIWAIRKASIIVLSAVMKILKMEGYTELSTGICQALLQYNIFIPEKISQSNDYIFRAEAFKSYWEDYNAFKIGELHSHNCWETYYHDQSVLESSTYIGNYEQKPNVFQVTQSNWLECERDNVLASWRPSHVNIDDDRIEQSAQSFVLFDDIEHLMQIYRDSENMQLLVDKIFDNLGFPYIFNEQPVDSQFVSWKTAKYIRSIVRERKFIRESETCSRYWNPLFNFQDRQFMVKTKYVKRLLRMLKLRMVNKKPIVAYQMFLEIVGYLRGQPKENLKQVLAANPENIEIWIMYIEAEYLKDGNKRECVNVYKQLLVMPNISRKGIYLVLYNMYRSCKSWQMDLDEVLGLMLNYMKNGSLEDRALKSYDVLKLFGVLQEKYRQFEKTKQKNKITKRHIVSYWIVDLVETYENSLQLLAEEIKTRLLEESEAVGYRILLATKKHGQKMPVRPEITSVDQLKYIVASYSGELFMLKHFLSKNIHNFNLSHWMICFCFINRSYNDKLFDLFFQYGSTLCKQRKLAAYDTTFTLDFIKIMTDHTSCPVLLLTLLDQMPYAKNLFLMYLKQCPLEDYQRIKRLMFEKELRIVYRDV